jgi:hypothetical protein
VLAAALWSSAGSATEGVVGGSPIQIQSAPWAVFVQDQTSTTDYDCSGSIIDQSHILTAAHCVYDDSGNLAPPAQLSVKAGVSNVFAPLSSDLEQDRTVSSFTVHPGYTYSSQAGPDDVAVLALSAPLDLSGPAVQAVALPASSAPFPTGAAVGLAGFGEQTPGTDPSGQLDWMKATIDPQGLCGGTEEVFDDDAVRLCASSPDSSTCPGDSGGGLVSQGSPPTLLGVVSAGPSGCTAGSHTTFTYTGAPEILSFVQGDQQPPTAPSQDSATFVNLDWNRPLVVGATLTCSSGDWVGRPVNLAYSFVTATGRTLQSGTRTTYTLQAADLGAMISCQAAATNAGGTAVAATIPTTPVKAAPQVTFSYLTPTTAVRGAEATFLVKLKVPLGLQGTFGVCLRPSARVGSPRCKSSPAQQGGPGSGEFDVKLSIKPTAPIGITELSVRGYAGVSRVNARTPLRITARRR